MRKYLFSILLGSSLVIGCTKNFDETNTDPRTAPDVPASALLTKGMLDVSGYDYATWRSNFIYTTLFVQQFASTGWPQGDKYFYDEGYSSAQWADYYPTTIKGLSNLVNKTSENADEVNYNSAGRVLKVIAYMRLTDLYGDIPYSQASKGYTEGALTPAYDKQQDIYNDLLKELDESATAFSAGKAFAGDISTYNGDVALWKKATYSLMLRLAMRLSKVDPATAKTWAAKAVTGGLISSYTESFRIKHLSGTYDNPNSHILGYYVGARTELRGDNFKFSKTFYDALNSTADPRLKILFVVPTVGADDPETDTPGLQKGLPNGTNPSLLASGELKTFSKLRKGFVDATDDNILISHAQTLLLQAEAAERGWASGTPATLFHDAVFSAINQLKLYGIDGSLFNDGTNQAFANAVPYAGTLDQKLQAINTQYWIASLLDGRESFSNWRRSGYPVLTAVNYSGNYTGGKIPRRLQYPSGETGVNKTNYDAAVARQGADNFVTRVWWDKP
ncbi:MAG TPA: SusD/RagB family nutrient-binding outer membrane lipoprotein [Chitinophagaceae bacterium]|nr:SusD/RagB family nutrient-binding outer membrane lipoprotein [Chitinophagaceae bacterium]